MAKDVDAVIAALKAALRDAEGRGFYECKARVANRWINQLPGAWTGKWRQLKIQSDILGNVERPDFIGQVRATIAYLETNRDAIQSSSSLAWPFKRKRKVALDQPLDADYAEVVPSNAKDSKDASKPVKLIKR